jgi:dUTPase
MEIPVYKFALTSELLDATAVHETLRAKDFLPTRSDSEASGWDVRCALQDGIDLTPGSYYKIPLGFRAFCPPGWWAELNPRSSSFIKKHLHALYGKIDETYPNQWFFLCQYVPDSHEIINPSKPKRLEFGDRIGQVIPVKRQEMEIEIISNQKMDEEIKKRDAARKGGLGSTGNN